MCPQARLTKLTVSDGACTECVCEMRDAALKFGLVNSASGCFGAASSLKTIVRIRVAACFRGDCGVVVRFIS